MKLCYLADASSVHTARWVNYFSRRGHQVDLLSFEPGCDLDRAVRVHRVGLHWPFKLHYLSAARVVKRLLKEIQPEILHAHYASSYGTVGRLTGFHPYVVSVWGSDVFDFARKSKIHRSIVASNLNRADRVCSTSLVMAQETRGFCQKEITWTPFGVDCDQFKPGTNGVKHNAEFVVGVVKTLEPIYGIEYLIRGFAIFAKRLSNLAKPRLVIAGSGSLLSPLRQLARNLDIGVQTTFHGFVPHDRVPDLLREFSVFVAPSSGSEAFGVAAVEASACALPLVVTNVGGLPEVVRDRVTGILIPPCNPSAIADALMELFENETLRREFGENGRRFVLENYEWTENASRMERLYQSLVSKQKFQMASVQ